MTASGPSRRRWMRWSGSGRAAASGSASSPTARAGSPRSSAASTIWACRGASTTRSCRPASRPGPRSGTATIPGMRGSGGAACMSAPSATTMCARATASTSWSGWRMPISSSAPASTAGTRRLRTTSRCWRRARRAACRWSAPIRTLSCISARNCRSARGRSPSAMSNSAAMSPGTASRTARCSPGRWRPSAAPTRRAR